MDEVAVRRRSWFRFGSIALGVVVVGGAGYLGFVAFVGADREIGAGFMVLAAATGFAAFFSPCSFPLLLTFLARRSAETMRTAVLSAVRVGAGATALLGLLAIGFALGGTALGEVISFDSGPGRALRLSVALLLVLVGLRQARLLGFRMQWLDKIAGSAGRRLDPSRTSSDARRDFVYGFGYLLTGFG